MSNVSYTPEPERQPPPSLDYEQLPSTGVRPMLAMPEGYEAPWWRWGAVLAGLFVTIGASILLSLFGLAIGVTAVNPLSAQAAQSFGIGAAIWWGVQSLITVFIGGFAAAKLGGAIRRGDGIVSGLLTWATALVFTMWLFGSAAGGALSSVATGAAAGAPAVIAMQPPGARAVPGQTQPPRAPTGPEVQQAKQAAAGTLWYTFAVSALSLVAGIGGGALGATGERRRYRGGGGVRREVSPAVPAGEQHRRAG